MTAIATFLAKVQSVHKTGSATEHSYRSALESLFDSLAAGITALNEPKRVACGAPDFIIQRGDLIIGHVEAKDIGIELRSMKDANKDQQDRYRNALPNLIYTNCLDWDFYRNGELVASASIAQCSKGIQPEPAQFSALELLLKDFITHTAVPITAPKPLAEIMAGKATLIKDVLHNALIADKSLETELAAQFKAFREHLIHDITPQDFSDIYAETITYGMFAARLHDKTPSAFNRQEALNLLPKSNPFLRSLFGYIAGPDLDDRIQWIIDDTAQVFQAADIDKIMDGFGKLTGKNDPFLHFYETFLTAYNPAKRRSRGVWYTPEPVVSFIVRAVDELLKTTFGISDGLAESSKITIDWDTGQTNKKGKPITIGKEVHRVQVLDPAVGTGTFLAEVIKQIAPQIKGVAAGMWSDYVERDLIPRLHGFELLMASYAMCHMKLDMILTALGYNPTGTPPRLSVFLTNALEKGEPANQTLPFAQWLSNEVKQANAIKRDMPIMCVIGNPPYNNSSQNQGEWIKEKVKAYKAGLTERKLNLDDDYIKFIRLAQLMIEKNGRGIVAMITNNSYLSGVTHRTMRRSLLESFDEVIIVNLHGDSNKKETTPDGLPDINVFDIMQGVAVMILCKRTNSKAIADVRYLDLYGTRQEKYAALLALTTSSKQFEAITPEEPHFFLTPKNFTNSGNYNEGFALDQMMPLNNSGVKTDRDDLFLDFDRQTLGERFQLLLGGGFDSAFTEKFNVKDSGSYKITKEIKKATYNDGFLSEIVYRPFDKRNIYYDPDLVSRAGFKAMRHMLTKPNVALVLPKYATDEPGALVVNALAGHKSFAAYDINYVFPLYLYPDETELDPTPLLNLDPTLYKKLKALAECSKRGTPGEVAAFDYIYGVLHSPAYRSAYAEFLRIDFPRIPWPATPVEFWHISEKGGVLRRLHLMDPSAVGATSYPLMGTGPAVVDAPRYEDGKIWINDSQHFDAVQQVSWDGFVGGYQPAQKWLKDRKGRTLSFEEVKHYQRILKILAETDRVMREIDLGKLSES